MVSLLLSVMLLFEEQCSLFSLDVFILRAEKDGRKQAEITWCHKLFV